MNNENSGEVEDGQIESPLNDSINSNSKTCQAVAENASESVKPPNSKIFQLQMDEIGSRIRETEEKLKSLDKQVLLSGGRINKSAAPVDKEKLHEELQDLRTQREKVIEERKQCDLELKGLNDQVRKMNDACTKLQAATRYKSEARIDEAVRRLEHQMQAQQLNLREEKRIVAEIDTLKRSKRSLKEYLDLKQHVDQLRNKQKHLRSQRDACVRRINGLKAREEKLKNQLDSADVCSENEEAKIQQREHLNTIEILKKELDDLHRERRERKAKFSKEKNDYYSAIREMKSQKQREEATRRKNEKQTMMKAVVSSRATQQLYEKEKSLCDTLISYMEKLHTSLVHLPEIQGTASIDKEPVVSLSASADFSSSVEGMFLRRKSEADDLVGVFAGVHRISRKGSRKGRRSSAKEAPRKLNLHPEVVEHLLTLGLSPPSTATDIPKVLGELHEKKEFYNNPPSSSSLLALASNDPMSPISEEATPEFPTKFEEKDASKTTDTSAQIESTAEKDEEGGENLHIIVPQSSLTEGHEVSSRKNLVEVNTESAENLNGLVPGTDENVSNVERVELEKSASSEISTDPAVASGNSDINVGGEENHKLTNTLNEPTGVSVVSSAPSDNLCDSGEVVANCSDVENFSHVKEEKQRIGQMLSKSEKTDITSQDNISTPLSHNSTSTEHPNFTSPSPHSPKLSSEQNCLESAYDKNPLNDGHNIVKIQYEKCPA
ncbi:uncharacterized protein [Pocillopora verrucosa]|uniref:uncharacterized protein n=1 Tax=Pocillopora verrucosa TaxID=203993 RepID=UPI0033429722